MPKLQADFGRNTAAVAAVAVVAVAGLSYAGYALWQNHSAPASEVAAVRPSGRPAQSLETEHYSKVLGDYNTKNAAGAAATSSDTYISVMSTRAKNVPPPPPGAAASSEAPPPPTYAPQTQTQQTSTAAPAPQHRAVIDTDHTKNLSEQVKGLLDNWTAQPHGLAKVSEDDKAYAQSLMPASLVQTGKTATGSQGEQKGQLLIPGFTDAPALLRTNIDTDESSETEALIPSGPYAGALVSAPNYKILGNSVDMTFTSMMWNGRTYKITAKAVDEHTLRTSLAGDVNNRYFSRIVLPALAAGIGRAGQLYQQAGTETVITPLGGAIQTSLVTPNLRNVGGTVLGGAGQAAATVLTRDAANTPQRQVLVAAGTTVGIRFLAPVFTGDELSGGALQAQAQAQTQSEAANETAALRRQAPSATNPNTDGENGLQASQALTVPSPFMAVQPAAPRNP